MIAKTYTSSIPVNNSIIDNADKIATSSVYGKQEELFNAFSHFVGILLSIFFGGWLFKSVSLIPSFRNIIAVIVYLSSLFLLYFMSTLYHALPQGEMKSRFQILDHCTIFLLIAGNYTPFCLIALWDIPAGKWILLIEWVFAIVGIALNIWNMKAKPVKIFSQCSYLIMGWMILFCLHDLIEKISLQNVIWLFVGGLCYTIGVIFYLLGKKVKYMHCLWHIFVLFGTALQFVSMTYLF